jgi:beta-glucosidase
VKFQTAVLSALTLVFAAPPFAHGAPTPTYLDPTAAVEARVEDLLRRLTLDEKIALIHGDSKFTTAGIPRLGIPVRWLSDGPHGVREEIKRDVFQPAGRTDDFATAMPCGSALAATWNPSLAERAGAVIGAEARARGKDIMLGPGVNIERSPLCGRNFEYFGEDPYLAGRMAVGFIRGEQSQDIASCVKHFAANNQETERGTIDVEMDERTLREIYLPAFRAAVQEAGVWAVMGAYNEFRGEHCCHNDYLLNGVLKGEWGFRGLVMSDWNGTHDTRQAARNGLDLEMGTEKRPYDDYFLARPYRQGLEQGVYPMAGLDDKVRRNLRVMIATHVLDKRAPGSLNTREHQAVAREVEEQGIVLLKNEEQALPLDPTKIKTIAVIGDNATRPQAHGGQSSEMKALYEVTPLQGIIRRVGRGVNVITALGYDAPDTDRLSTRPQKFDEPLGSTELADRAVAAARAADVVIFVGGLNHELGNDCESRDRVDMKLPYGQDALLSRIVEANPRTVVVLVAGAPVEMGSWIARTPAVLQAWYGGMEAGDAIARVLFGDVNPSGKLPCTFPRTLADSPAHALDAWPGKNGVVQYKEGILVGYRWFDAKRIEPQYPFGHGLSYTTFAYAHLAVRPARAGEEGVAVAEVDVANTGKRAGAEVVQLYVRDPEASLPRPPQELKAFAKVSLKPGEHRTVSLPLGREAFAFYDPARKSWVAEAGKFVIAVGSSSRDLRGTADFDLKQTMLWTDADRNP